MYVACSTQCFARLPLDRALRLIAELEFSKVDVGIIESGSHLKPSEVVADIPLAAQRIRIGPSVTPAAFTVEIETPDPAEFDRQLLAICKLARMSSVSVLSFKAAKSGTSTEAEVERVKRLVQLVEKEGLVFTLITCAGTLTEFPSQAVDLCKRVPGLGLTLDPSHFIHGPNQGNNFDEVFPFVRHVQLRDSGKAPGKFQVRIGQGEVEYGRIITLLQRHRYNRLLSVAIQDVPDANFVMESEVRKLKFLLESLV